jgi:hypothetical protein
MNFENLNNFWNYLNKKEIEKRFKRLMDWIWPMASAFRGLPASPAPDRSGSACSVRPKAEAVRLGPLARW